MDFRTQRHNGYANEEERNLVLAVPSVDGGTFLVDHGEYFGTQTHQEIGLGVVSDEVAEAINGGDVSVALERIEAIKDRPGFYRVMDGIIGEATISIPGTGNALGGRVTEFVELAPVVDLPDPTKQPHKAARIIAAVQAEMKKPENVEGRRRRDEAEQQRTAKMRAETGIPDIIGA